MQDTLCTNASLQRIKYFNQQMAHILDEVMGELAFKIVLSVLILFGDNRKVMELACLHSSLVSTDELL